MDFLICRFNRSDFFHEKASLGFLNDTIDVWSNSLLKRFKQTSFDNNGCISGRQLPFIADDRGRQWLIIRKRQGMELNIIT